MSKTKIGEDLRAKLDEAGPYYVIGIAKQADDTFAVMQLKVHGMDVEVRKVLKKASTFAEAMLEYQIESGAYGMKYLNKEVMKK